MSRRTFDFSDGEKAVLEDMLEKLFLLNVEFSQKDAEVSKLLRVKPGSYETSSNFSILYHCLLDRISKAEKELKELDDMLARLRGKECFL